MPRTKKAPARLAVDGVVALFSVCDTPRGPRKGALVIAMGAGKLYVHEQRHGAMQRVKDFVNQLKEQGDIDPAHWLECDVTAFVLRQRFIQADGFELPGTGPNPYEQPLPDDYEVEDGIKFARTVGTSRWMVLPQPAEANDEPIAA